MKKVCVVGGGIVGASAAYFLDKDTCDVTVYDVSEGQGTKAAVGIICPWVNQRRNKEWYHLVSQGAHMYWMRDTLFPNQDFYRKTGTLITHDRHFEKLRKIAIQRSFEHPEMGDVTIIGNIQKEYPLYRLEQEGILVSGGGVVDGEKLVNYLLKDINVQHQRVKEVVAQGDGYLVDGVYFDEVILATGAYLPELLPNYEVDVRPQKGQLIEYHDTDFDNRYPVLMPSGNSDVMVDDQGSVTVGATHEDDRGYSLDIEIDRLEPLFKTSRELLPSLSPKICDNIRIGIRAYTSDFLPFFGAIEPGLFVASGLGSSGLTSGIYIGKRLADWTSGVDHELVDSEYSPKKYIKPVLNQ